MVRENLLDVNYMGPLDYLNAFLLFTPWQRAKVEVVGHIPVGSR